MPSRINQSRSWCVSEPVIIACLVAASAAAQTARDVRGAAAVERLRNQSPARIGLAPGRHKILIHLVNANHQLIEQGTVQVTVPAAKPQAEAHQRSEVSL